MVEDDDQIRQDLDENLTQDGYRVICASDGLSALVALKNNRLKLPSLILLDLLMPVMNGEDFLKILYREPQFKRIPVIILSVVARSMPKVADFIKKPFVMPDLLEKIAEHIA